MKKFIAILFVGALLIVLFMGKGDTALAGTDASAARQAVVDSNAQWMAALAKRDAPGIAARYTKDARLFPPNSPEVNGRDAVQAFFQGGLDLGMGQITLTAIEVTLHEGVAIERGTYSSASATSGDAQPGDTGKYLVVWKQEAGEWKMSMDIWNSDLPAS